MVVEIWEGRGCAALVVLAEEGDCLRASACVADTLGIARLYDTLGISVAISEVLVYDVNKSLPLGRRREFTLRRIKGDSSAVQYSSDSASESSQPNDKSFVRAGKHKKRDRRTMR